MTEAILAIDAGTTSVRALLVSAAGRRLARRQCPLSISTPAPGRVEQDGEELWRGVLSVVSGCLVDAKLSADAIAAIGITTQRSCVVVWEKSTQVPVAPIVGWQDLRGVARAEELMGAGHLVLPQTAAAKLEAVVDAIPDGRRRAADKEIVWGPIDSYLIARLSAGHCHVTDASAACATGYFDFGSFGWSEALLGEQGFSNGFFPNIVDTFGQVGETEKSLFGANIPITALVADQQSALLGHGLSKPGAGKITFGTSTTVNVLTAQELCLTDTAYPLLVSKSGDQHHLCIEGMVPTGGSALQWLAGMLGLGTNVSGLQQLASSVQSSDGVCLLPALQGIGTPYIHAADRGAITGLSLASRPAHIAFAAFEGLSFRVAEIVAHIYENIPYQLVESLCVDGGGCINDHFMQLTADRTGLALRRLALGEATAVGAVRLAGQAIGFFDASALDQLSRVDREFEPTWSADRRQAALMNWQSALGLVDG